MQRFYSLKHSAEMMDISTRTLHRIIKKEGITAHKIGARLRLSKSQIESMIKQWSPTTTIVDEMLHK